MLLTIKMFGGLTCANPDSPYFGSNKLNMEVPEGVTIQEVHQLLNLQSATNFVSIVNGHAQPIDFILKEDCTISIFPPVTNSNFHLFTKLKQTKNQ